MMKKVLVALLFLSACSQNILSQASSINDDEDYYDQALSELNIENYDNVVSIITTKMSSSVQAQIKVRELLASAYAGKCGLNFVSYTNALAEQTTGSAMQVMMGPFVGVDSDPASCRLALQTMELIGPTESRNTNQNLFTSIVGMVLLGTALRNAADVSPVQGDGTADVNICTTVTDAQMDDVILGFGFFNKNFSAVSATTIGNYSDSSMSDAAAACNAGVGAGVCQIIDPTLITPSIRDAYRDLTNTSDYGIGAVSTGGNPMLIPAACP